MTHEQRVKQAQDAINEVFGDRTVSAERTVESLGELIGSIDTMLDTMESDEKRKRGQQ